MMRSSKLRTRIALAGGAALLAGGGLFAAAGAANATTHTHPSGSLQVANSGQATAGQSAPSSVPATLGLPKGGTVAKATLLPSTPGSPQVASPNASASDVAPATPGTGTAAPAPNPSGSLQVANSGQATAGQSAPSSVPATLGLPKGGTVAKATLLPSTPGSPQVASPNASASDVAPAQTS